MPTTKEVRTLKQACLRNISKNIDRLWSADFDRFLCDLPRLLYVLGPFEYLTSELIQELLDTLSADRRLRRSHLHLLLTSRLDHLDFSRCASLTNMLHLVGIRCQKLTKLDLSNCSTATPTALCSVFYSLPLLRWLGLRQTKSNDQVLAAILSSCQKLMHLNLFACPVTEKGVLRICQSLQEFNKSQYNYKSSPNGTTSLLYLDISATKIGSKGAMAILETFPNLRLLQYADVIDAVAELSSTTGEGLLKLRTLTATGIKCKDISPESVQLSCLRCPFATEVYFYQTATDSSLQFLKGLKHLTTLEVTSDQWGDVTFFDGLKPLFQDIGTNIESLGLYDIKDLDIGQLGVLCPNLKRLKCVMAVFNSVAFVETCLSGKELRNIYKHLENLTFVIGSDETNFTASIFEQMLQNAVKLCELHLINVQCLSSEILSRVLERHEMPCLSTLTLESCQKITESALSQLISSDNPLKNLCLRNCSEISRSNVESFRKYAKNNNLNLNIVWE